MLPKQKIIPKRTKRITSEWLNQVLHDSGYLEDVNIESISREPWGSGEGFMSDMARLTITYDNESPNLPKTMIVKMPTTFRTAIAIGLQFNLYEKEIRFYTEVAPESPIRVPGLIYSDYDLDTKKYILILEDCSCYKMVDQVKGLNYEQTKQAIISIADFHARWWDAPDLFSFDWIPKPKDETITKAFTDLFRNSWDLAIKSEEFLGALPEGGRKVGDKIYKHFRWLMEDLPDENMTFAHFDYRADNIFFDSENSDNPIIVFDWANLVITGGILDVGYLLGTSLDVNLRRKIEKEMVKFYMKRIEEANVTRDFDFDEVWENYLRSLSFCAWTYPLTFT
ncbi:MAG: phosphotransferase, partial [Promethearchaeota archaeon]